MSADTVSTSPGTAPPGDSESSKSASVLFTIPYQWDRGDPAKNTKILDFLSEHPWWITVPTDIDGRRRLYSAMMVNPQNHLREVWNGGELVGMLYLGDVIPGVSGTVHWIFMDKKLAGKRRLLWTWFGQCFTTHDLQRLTLYVPEFVGVLEDYARVKLGFKYEGQDRAKAWLDEDAAGTGKRKRQVTTTLENPHVWIARQGSRRERAHWHEGSWHDIHVLRLIRMEYEAQPAP